MSVNNNAQRTIDGQNTLFCDSIEVNEEIILNGDNGVDGAIIKSDGVNARWALLSSLLVAGTGINITGTTISTDIKNLTAGSNIAMASVDGLETTYNGSKAITIASANTEYTAGTGLSLSVGNEFTTNNPSTTQFFPIQQTGVAGLPSGLLYYDTLFGRLDIVP